MRRGRKRFPIFIVLVTLLWSALPLPYAQKVHDTLSSSAPPAPIPISPENGTSIENRRPVFVWQEVPMSSNYSLQLDRAANFSTDYHIEVNNIPEQQFVPEDAISLGRWFWRVRAINTSGASLFSETMILYIIPSRTTPVENTPILIVILFLSTIAMIVFIARWYHINCGEKPT